MANLRANFCLLASRGSSFNLRADIFGSSFLSERAATALRALEHMILGQLRVGARQMTSALLVIIPTQENTFRLEISSDELGNAFLWSYWKHFRSSRTSYSTFDSRPPARPSRAKNQDHPTYAIFLKSRWFKDIKYDNMSANQTIPDQNSISRT